MLYLGLNGELLDLRDKEHVVEEKRVAVRCTTAFCNKKVKTREKTQTVNN